MVRAHALAAVFLEGAAVLIAAILLVVTLLRGGEEGAALRVEERWSALPQGPHEHLASLERTTCYGRCPAYKVTIFRDGAIEYEGQNYVELRGKAAGRLRPDQILAIEWLFQRSGYLGFADSYEEEHATDHSSAFTAYSPAGGRRKAVRHYHGDMNAPEALSEIEEGIDRIIGVEQWIGSRECRRDDNCSAAWVEF